MMNGVARQGTGQNYYLTGSGCRLAALGQDWLMPFFFILVEAHCRELGDARARIAFLHSQGSCALVVGAKLVVHIADLEQCVRRLRTLRGIQNLGDSPSASL